MSAPAVEPYTFAAQKNPVHSGSLLAVAPVVHRLRGCLALTLSVDGRNFSSFQPLLPCHAYGERASHQPVAGGVTLDGDTVSFWVHRSVPSISFGALTPEPLKNYRHRSQPPANVAIYKMPAERLRKWTRRALASLAS